MSNMASLFRVLSLSLSVALFSSGLSSVTQAEEFEINATALQQIQALLEEKASLTPAQRKINIHLLHLLKKAKKTRGKEALTSSDFPNLRSFVKVDDEGTTLLDIKAEAEVIAQLGVLIVAQGGTIVSSVAEYGTIRARVPLEKIELLANSPYVQSVNPAIRAITNKLNT
ncbi:MAG TPA: hypothetical protein DCM38_12365 [Gammaproteobacteria bacterium]|nr:hypothetical protein [Gammaproteobacteria bacterium]